MQLRYGLSFMLLCLTIKLLQATPADTIGIILMPNIRLHHGFVLIHSRELVPVRHSNPSGIELNLNWHKVSQQAWESCHCYPKVGAALSFWDFDQRDILGHSVTGMAYVEPVFGAWRPLSFSVRAAFGASYQSKPYDPIANPLNQSYSTHVAMAAQLGGSAHIRLGPQWLLDVSAVYNHISNGGVRDPNKGINWPTAALGVGYYLDAPDFHRNERKNWRIERSPDNRLDVSFFMAFKEPVSKTYLFSPGMEVKFSHQVARISAITIGSEWLYDNGTRFEIAQAGRTESPQKAGIALGHEFLFGRFIFSQQLGAYVYRPFRVRDDLYQRYTLMYRYSPHVSFGGSLKAHKHVADFLDFRIGWSF